MTKQFPPWVRRLPAYAPALIVLAAIALGPALFAADGGGGGPSAPTTGNDPGAAQPSMWGSNIMLLVVFGALMLFMLLTSSRSAKAEEAKKKALIESLKPGMKVVTTSGMIAEVERIGAQGDTLWLTLGEGKGAVQVEYLRTAIASRHEPAAAATAAANGKK
jgi:preprotein translocase YajC subunit